MHIFSCTFLGSYAIVVPFAFYFGSSLTYIVINVIALDTVAHYSEAIGFPPFEVCGEFLCAMKFRTLPLDTVLLDKKRDISFTRMGF